MASPQKIGSDQSTRFLNSVNYLKHATTRSDASSFGVVRKTGI